MTSAVFHYLGPAFAVLLFAEIPVVGVAWLRIASAAAVFAVWRHPWRIIATQSSLQRCLLLALGCVLGAMNVCFYEAIARLPLSTVGAIEFVSPIILALVGVRSWRNVAAFALTVAGVAMLSNVRFAGDPLAFLLAFVNCALFMLYIVISHRIAQDGTTNGIDRLGAAMLVALVVVSPFGMRDAAIVLTRPDLLLASVGVGVCSSVIPYVLDQLAMARLPRATFALLLALLPVCATLISVIVLRQIPTLTELTGIALVVCGVAAHREK